jgi:hypothetical protein
VLLVLEEVLLMELVLVLMPMVVVEIHEHLGEENLSFRLVLMLHLMDDCVLIEGQKLMRYYVLNQNCCYAMMNLIHCLLVQNLLVFLVLCVSTQVRFVCYLNLLFVEHVAFLVLLFVVVVGLQLPQLMPQQQQ